ncbi:MAG TPA: hypothetical protein VMV89_03635 [Candidatus Paceibacterota bacterium]|nr:hypothetical protein [Candidatus Paceibacterota bacterium]
MGNKSGAIPGGGGDFVFGCNNQASPNQNICHETLLSRLAFDDSDFTIVKTG